MTKSSVQTASLVPPTDPGRIPVRKSSWQVNTLILALIASVFVVVLTVAYYAAYGRHILLLPSIQRFWFTIDAILQLGISVLLALAIALHLRRRIAPFTLYFIWSALHVLWLPVSTAAFVLALQVYPPPVVLLPAVTLFVFGPVGFLVVTLFAIAYWLFLPIFVLLFFCRRIRVL